MGEEDRERRSAKDEIPISPVSDDVWKLILDRMKVTRDMVHLLKGETEVPERGSDGRITTKIIQVGTPVMNEKGIRFFSTFLYTSMTPDKLTTNISDDEMKQMMREMTLAIKDIIIERGDEFEIAASDRTWVLLQLEHFYEMALSASRRGTILSVLKPTFKREESYTPQKPQSEKKSWLPSFLGGG